MHFTSRQVVLMSRRRDVPALALPVITAGAPAVVPPSSRRRPFLVSGSVHFKCVFLSVLGKRELFDAASFECTLPGDSSAAGLFPGVSL